MTIANFQVGQKVNYSNGPYTSTGTIVKITEKTLIVIDNEAGMELWNAGGACGAEITVDQVN